MSAICAFGCAGASRCVGKCHPAPRTPERCKWCVQGDRPRDGFHAIVRSLWKPTIELVTCLSGGGS